MSHSFKTIDVSHVGKTVVTSDGDLSILHDISLQIERGESIAIVGSSGSGKSTLLNIIGLLDQPTSGELYLLGQPTREMHDEARTALRGNSIGFVFQFHHLIQAFTAIENLSLIHISEPTRPY